MMEDIGRFEGCALFGLERLGEIPVRRATP